ncbi:hypothetical protein [Gloeothece verrucosa]|uniref:Pyruvate carboxyltransferase n=1 Tax=Gloeothece verrucosa (strain PCC 7822) TaxID=497965 RepID=E0UK57_GLOV7|nr:hypothetical protein [Gloeothece verrucosa]ADN15819.1 pyruvate carboxyltransferase [Gloeothece verrucosa PCC 7822]
MNNLSEQILILDTTMRDGELVPGIKMSQAEKLRLAQLLEEAKVDIIEVSYPAKSQQDFDEIVAVSREIKNSIVCALSNLSVQEIERAATGLKSASRGRIHLYSNVNLAKKEPLKRQEALSMIQQGVTLARNYCDDIEWSAFDASRSDLDFLCRGIEMAINSGAKTINIPDSLGVLLPAEFAQLLEKIFTRVPNIDKSIVSVHCHDDCEQALLNSLIALEVGVRQIECSLNGLGARKGNANLKSVIKEIDQNPTYKTSVILEKIPPAEELVKQISASN